MPKVTIRLSDAENIIATKNLNKTGFPIGEYIRASLGIMGADDVFDRKMKGLPKGDIESTVSSLVLHLRVYPKAIHVRRLISHSFNISVEEDCIVRFAAKERGMTVSTFLRSLALMSPLSGMPLAISVNDVQRAKVKAEEVEILKQRANVESDSLEARKETKEEKAADFFGAIKAGKDTEKALTKMERAKLATAEKALNALGRVWTNGKWVREEKSTRTDLDMSYGLLKPALIASTTPNLPCSVSVRFERTEEQGARDIATQHGVPLRTYGRIAGLSMGPLGETNGLGTSVMYDFYFGASEMRQLRALAKGRGISVENYLRRRILGGFKVPSLFDDKGRFKLWNVL